MEITVAHFRFFVSRLLPNLLSSYFPDIWNFIFVVNFCGSYAELIKTAFENFVTVLLFFAHYFALMLFSRSLDFYFNYLK